MKNFRVVLEIEVQEETPLEAAKLVQKYLQEPNSDWQFYVQEDENGSPIHSIDLEECNEDAVLNADNYTPLIKN